MRRAVALFLLLEGCSDAIDPLSDAEPVRNDSGTARDVGRLDTGSDAANMRTDAPGLDSLIDGGDDGGEPDAAALDAREDMGVMDAGGEAGVDAGPEAGVDLGDPDAGAPAMVIVSPIKGLLTDESGAGDIFTVVLNRAPAAIVTLTLASSDPTEGQVAPLNLAFAPSAWSVTQTVSVSGLGDLIFDGDEAYSILTSTTSSSDPSFDGIAVDDVGVVNLDVPVTCLHILTETPTAATGSYRIDPDGHGAVPAFDASCDMTTDGGGWTLLGRGAWWNGAAFTLPPGTNAQLPDGVTAAVGVVSTGLYRAGSNAQRFYIQDLGARVELGFHYWRTDAASLSCATSYAAVTGSAMVTTNVKSVNCDALGLGLHSCGSLNGWILLHRNDTYNIDGNHPCSFGAGELPTAGALLDLWVR